MNTTNGPYNAQPENTLPVLVTRSGRIIYETNSASHIILWDKDGVDIIFHSHFSHIHSRFFYNADSQKWAAARKHKTYNGIPFQLAESTNLFSFQATSFPILNRLYCCHQEGSY